MLGMPLSTLSTYVGAMLARGDARRIPNPTDGRSVRLVLTDRGRGVVRTVNPAFKAALVALEAGLDRPVGRGPGRAARDPGCDRPRRRRPQGDRYFELVVSCGPCGPADLASIESRCPCSCWLRCSAAVPARTRSPRAARSDAARRPQSARARAAARPPASATATSAAPTGSAAQDRRPWLPGRAAQGDPSRPVPRRGRGGLHGAGRQDRGRGTVV